jgi:hypothetical protein
MHLWMHICTARLTRGVCLVFPLLLLLLVGRLPKVFEHHSNNNLAKGLGFGD